MSTLKTNALQSLDLDALVEVSDLTNLFQPALDNLAALRGYSKTKPANRVRVYGYYTKGDGGGGVYYYDATDTTSPDNGGTTIVANDGGRWKLVVTGAISVRQFGAKGDAVADDTVSLQRALDYAGSAGGSAIIFPSGKYNISAPLVYQPTVTLPPALVDSDIHFSDHVESFISGSGDARLVATAAMAQMITLQFNSGLSAIGPFYTTIQGLMFDGADIATTAIYSDYTMNVSLLKNKIRRVANGISYTGYGVAKIRDNVIKASANCINFSGGGGDSDISSNDFYPMAGAVGVRVGALGGNCTINKNVFNGEGLANCIGVYLDGVSAGPSNSVINVRVLDNEFSGMVYAVYGQRDAAVRNVFGIIVSDNHTIPAAGGAVHTGQLVSFNGVDDVIVSNNFINGGALSVTLTTAPGVSFVDCRRIVMRHNKIGNLLGPAAYFIDSSVGNIAGNEIRDVGRNSAGGVMIDVDTGTNLMTFLENNLTQTDPSFAQNSIFERAGADNNEFLRNMIRGAGRVTRVGATSVVSGRVVASGSYSLSGAVATLQGNSHGFTVNRTAVGVCTVTLASVRPDADFRVKVSADAPQVAIDTFSTSSFVVRTYNTAGVALDATRVQIEVID